MIDYIIVTRERCC